MTPTATSLTVLDLFSGIGGFSLGLERTKRFRTVAFCENDKHARRVLAKHWPDVPIYGDVEELTADKMRADGLERVDVMCGGFPCQDISISGEGAGLDGERSGLWRHFARLIGEVRPQFVIVENVAALLFRGMGDVLGDMAAIGYDAEWHCIPASAIGSPQQRDRLWIISYPMRARSEIGLSAARHWKERDPRITKYLRNQLIGRTGRGFWATESELGRVANGVPNRTHRLKQLGNAVVPQIPELIGEAIAEAIDEGEFE